MPVHINWPTAIGIIVPNLGGWAGAIVTRRNITLWYKSLNKPTWTPPNWMFAPVWTSLYSSIGYASYLVYRDGGGFEKAAIPLSIYGVNLVLNWLWTPIFFGAHNIKLALYEIAALWGSTVVLGISFFQVNKLAGGLIVPYLAWNTLATALTYSVYRNNEITDVDEKKK
ncbi:translocator protein [Microplitis demolitor]|uniref:translocator protein n=1 Tax=Microplitis demolitor TaxID=69319 RepID=UPI0004CDD100|nr:translocator protein [Microplitis demolitor]